MIANHEAVLEIQAVCPDERHTLKKLVNWQFQAFCRPGLSVLGSLFKRTLAQVQLEKEFLNQNYPSIKATQTAQIEETNHRMIRSHAGKGFEWSKE